jgi:hypothetical protein
MVSNADSQMLMDTKPVAEVVFSDDGKPTVAMGNVVAKGILLTARYPLANKISTIVILVLRVVDARS